MSPSTSGRSIGEDKAIVVVGGGISGLYCARELARRGYAVEILEATKRLGGRVETTVLSPGPSNRGTNNFNAEMGPMRFELKIQPLVLKLLDEYEIKRESFTPPTPGEPPIDYELEARYRSKSGLQLSSLELLKLGVYRLFPDQLEPVIDERKVKGKPRAKVVLLRGRQWVNALSDKDGSFDALRRDALMPGTSRPLRDFGFWNVLYTTLSPRAVAKILHFGTFYHLMPDNPNAAEWAIFWLRLFQPAGERLSTIPAGVERVVDELVKELSELQVSVLPNQEVVDLRPAADPLRVEIEIEVERRSRRTLTADHVILALPKEPLVRLADGFPAQTGKDIDAVIAFPLLKVFCVTDTPSWWAKPQKPQQGAWLAPTREVHYFPRTRLGARTLILFYTDRPATAFWQPYVCEPTVHHEAEKNRNHELQRTLTKILFEMHWTAAYEHVRRTPAHPLLHHVNTRDGGRLLDVLSEFRASTVKIAETDPMFPEFAQQTPALVKDVSYVVFNPEGVWRWQLSAIRAYAIRDWSRPPYGAGCHAWKPGAQSWEVRRRLAAFGFDANAAKNLHVCGEAYSDYQGFIEGALRSAVDACNSILDGDCAGPGDLLARD